MKTLKDYDNKIKAIENGILRKLDEEIDEINNQLLPLMKAEAVKNPMQFIDEFFSYISLTAEAYLRRNITALLNNDELEKIAEKIHDKDYEDFTNNNDYYEIIMSMKNKYSPHCLVDKFYTEAYDKTAFIDDYEAILRLQKESEALREYEARKAQLDPIISKLPL